MIHINDLPFRKFCSKGNYLFSERQINLDLSFCTKEDRYNFFSFFIFTDTLLGLVKKILDGKEIVIDNLYDYVFSKCKLFLDPKKIHSPTYINKIEKISLSICSKINFILNDINGGQILALNKKFNYSVKTIGDKDYIYTFSDLVYVNSNSELKIILFLPTTYYNTNNLKTSLNYKFWSELFEFDHMHLFFFGTNYSLETTNLIDSFVPFNETLISLTEQKKTLLNDINNSIFSSYYYNNISYEYCYFCQLKNKCDFKL